MVDEEEEEVRNKFLGSLEFLAIKKSLIDFKVSHNGNAGNIFKYI